MLLNRPLPAKMFLTTSAIKVNAGKHLTQMLFINIPALQLRAFPTLEKRHDKYSYELQTTAEQIKTAQYLNTLLIAHPVKTLT